MADVQRKTEDLSDLSEAEINRMYDELKAELDATCIRAQTAWLTDYGRKHDLKLTSCPNPIINDASDFLRAVGLEEDSDIGDKYDELINMRTNVTESFYDENPDFKTLAREMKIREVLKKAQAAFKDWVTALREGNFDINPGLNVGPPSNRWKIELRSNNIDIDLRVFDQNTLELNPILYWNDPIRSINLQVLRLRETFFKAIDEMSFTKDELVKIIKKKWLATTRSLDKNNPAAQERIVAKFFLDPNS